MRRQIEDYLRARGAPYFRGHHDDEYFFLVDFVSGAYRGRLNVHLQAPDAGDDAGAVLVTISPDRYFPAEKAEWLGKLADRWNAETHPVQAVVHGSCDPRLVGVQARGGARPGGVPELSAFVDDAVNAGTDLFGRLAGAALPASGPVLRDAG